MVPWRQAAVFSAAVLLLCTYRFSYRPANVKTTARQQTKYILLWGDLLLSPFDFMGKGSSAFLKNGCAHTNCFVTSDRRFLEDIEKFDAIVFNGRYLADHLKYDDLPQHRSANQKYVYTNMESSHNYPVCNAFLNGFFNWTWTYRLSSDSRLGYFTIYDLNGTEVGPRADMHWPQLDPIDNATKMHLASKSKAAAWFVSNCHSLSRREAFARAVAAELQKHNHSVHIYGRCGKRVCPRWNAGACFELLAKDYYFYFAFENSFDEDYVTEKVLTALNNYAIPVVFGGANYSRFLPPGAYLNALELGPELLAESMAAIIHSHRSLDSYLYYDFFRWRNHFTYNITFDMADVCKLCKTLNDPDLTSKQSVYRDFAGWWNSPLVDCKKIISRRRREANSRRKRRYVKLHPKSRSKVKYCDAGYKISMGGSERFPIICGLLPILLSLAIKNMTRRHKRASALRQ